MSKTIVEKGKELLNSARGFLKKGVLAVSTAITAVALTVTSFAADPPSYVVLTPENLAPITDSAMANANVVVPVAVGILVISFGLMFGLGLFRKIARH